MRHQPLFYSFWSINGPLDQGALRTQMDQFQEAGLDGVVFHPRSYPGIPPYLSPRYLAELSAAISYAKSIGLRFWLYDENGFPSGTADGQLFTRFPEDVAVRLELVSDAQPDAVASFWTSENGLCDSSENGHRQWFLKPQSLRGLDCMTPEPCLNFLGLIHEQYRTGLTPEAFDYVEAIFTDEPETGISWAPAQTVPAVPWSRHMLSELREKFGANVESRLPLLFSVGRDIANFASVFGSWSRT